MERNQLSQLLEREVNAIRQLDDVGQRSELNCASGPSPADKHYRKLLTLLRPRIAWLIRRCGLSHMRQDAEQACAIGIHRAVQAWDPSRASFATLVHWQMRGELQSLRHRMMPNQRQGARTAGVRTVAWHNSAGLERAEVAAAPDDTALSAAERGASDAMVQALLDRLLGKIGSPAHERRIVRDVVFAQQAGAALDRKSRERNRQIARRTFRNCAKAVAG